jgi:hypothetical protein
LDYYFGRDFDLGKVFVNKLAIGFVGFRANQLNHKTIAAERNLTFG